MDNGKLGMTEETEKPWHASFPSPTTVPASVSRDEVLQWLRREEKSDFVLIDLRRTDCEGGMIHGSINLPAQSIYHTIPALYKLFTAAGIKKVVWFCGSSRGRGTRAAGWFADYLRTKNDGSMQSVTLAGGIKGWVAGGEDFVRFMDGFEKAAWSETLSSP